MNDHEFLVAIALGALIIVLMCCNGRKKVYHLPPGPRGLPIVGYLPWLNPMAPHLTLTNLVQKYGPIYSLQLGSIKTIVLADARLVRKAFNTSASTGRAPLYLTHGIMKGCGLICAQGDLWRDQRRFVHNHLRLFGAARTGSNRGSLEKLILHHIEVDFIKYITKLNGTQFILDPVEPLRHTLGCIINQLVFGQTWDRDDQEWLWLQKLQEEGTRYIGVTGPLNFLPILRFLPKFKRMLKFIMDGLTATHDIYAAIIQKQIAILKQKERAFRLNANPDEQPEPIVPENFIQAFLLERERREDTEDYDNFYNDEQFHYLLADLFGATLDTTLTTLRWFFLFVAANPQIQYRIRMQLKDALKTGPLTMETLSQVPYLEACIAETQRIRSVVPLGIPHGTIYDFELEEYTIPYGTMIIPLQWAIHMDPTKWDDPELFNPDRFLNEDGEFFKNSNLIPFQVGKRMCVGEEFAKMLLFFFIAKILDVFQIDLINHEMMDFTGVSGITLTPQNYKLKFRATNIL